MATHDLTQPDLDNFTGTEVWFRHSLNRTVTYTQGVQYMAKHAGAYWLIDEIALVQSKPKLKAEPFQVWNLTVTDRSAKLVCDDGNGKVLYRKAIEYTDFPLPAIKLYLADHVILLPSEY